MCPAASEVGAVAARWLRACEAIANAVDRRHRPRDERAPQRKPRSRASVRDQRRGHRSRPELRVVTRAIHRRWPPYIVSLIKVGVLLDVARPWSDRKLLGDLRSFEGFAPARTELEIWAALAKAGYRFDREPFGPDGRRPDFAVRVAGRRYIVEVKSLLASDGERLADALRTSMLAIGDGLRRPGVTVSVSGQRSCLPQPRFHLVLEPAPSCGETAVGCS
jgi:hypothetical protein